MSKKKILIVGGGTISHVRSHLQLCAYAKGTTARTIAKLCEEEFGDKFNIDLALTEMALDHHPSDGRLVTNDDVAALLAEAVECSETKIVFMTAALCDFHGFIHGVGGYATDSGKYEPRLRSRDGEYTMSLLPANKVIGKIRKSRKDIFLVGFKQTCGLSEDEQYIAGLNLCKEASCNLVFANDSKTKLCMVITPEEARYHVTADRIEALRGLVKMTQLRSHLTFTRSTVVSGDPVSWDSDLVPPALRTVVDYCISQGAYKPFRGVTTGHFACKLDDKTFLTSKRRTNFNDIASTGLVKVKVDGPDSVIAYGAKPSVGGQSQRIIFNEHVGMDCIVHFHCPIKPDSPVPTVSQYEFECGSHECGKNTSNGLADFCHGRIKAVYLEHHGPNIVFHKSVDPELVCQFIDANFNLDEKTGGYVSIEDMLKTKSTADYAAEVLG